MKSKVLIYSKNPCPYCVRAKEFFKQQNIPFEEIDLTDKPDEILALKQRTGHRTVPQIFFGEQFIGGYTDLIEKLESGKLDLEKLRLKT